ncbi:MAG TPA: DUF3105 domain-containing protein, partial [Ilumatobacteraceae bacterium]|nr:DUF3105 domain-containing protein [Ilumatobacteraceae bacterium]
MRRLAVLVLLPLFFVACGSDSNSSTSAPGGTGAPTPGEPEGTVTYTGLTRNHVDTPVDYPQTPPVGGNHNPVWQNCQYYDTSVPNERAVHSLEHGAVWITYGPDTSQADKDVLKAIADQGDHILISEYDGLPAPIVATAWGKQLLLQSVSDPRLQQFVDVFQSGPQTPEPGVTCRDSTSA